MYQYSDMKQSCIVFNVKVSANTLLTKKITTYSSQFKILDTENLRSRALNFLHVLQSSHIISLNIHQNIVNNNYPLRIYECNIYGDDSINTMCIFREQNRFISI